MLTLIGIASTKFIMSHSGRICSIILTLGLRVLSGGVVVAELGRRLRKELPPPISASANENTQLILDKNGHQDTLAQKHKYNLRPGWNLHTQGGR